MGPFQSPHPPRGGVGKLRVSTPRSVRDGRAASRVMGRTAAQLHGYGEAPRTSLLTSVSDETTNSDGDES